MSDADKRMDTAIHTFQAFAAQSASLDVDEAAAVASDDELWGSPRPAAGSTPSSPPSIDAEGSPGRIAFKRAMAAAAGPGIGSPLRRLPRSPLLSPAVLFRKRNGLSVSTAKNPPRFPTRTPRSQAPDRRRSTTLTPTRPTPARLRRGKPARSSAASSRPRSPAASTTAAAAAGPRRHVRRHASARPPPPSGANEEQEAPRQKTPRAYQMMARKRQQAPSSWLAMPTSRTPAPPPPPRVHGASGARSCRAPAALRTRVSSPVRRTLKVSDYLGLAKQIEAITAELVADYSAGRRGAQIMTALNQVSVALQRIVCDMGFSSKTADAVAQQVPRHKAWDSVSDENVTKSWKQSPTQATEQARSLAETFNQSRLGFQPSQADRVRADLARQKAGLDVSPERAARPASGAEGRRGRGGEKDARRKSWIWRKLSKIGRRRDPAASAERKKKLAEISKKGRERAERAKLRETHDAAEREARLKANAIAKAALAAARRRLADLDEMLREEEEGAESGPKDAAKDPGSDGGSDAEASPAVELRVRAMMGEYSSDSRT